MNFVFEKIESDDEFLNFVNCPDINHSGIRRFTPCPIAFTSIRFKTSESDIYRAFSKNIKCLDTPIPGEKYIIASGVAHAPIDWCGPDSNMNGFDSSQPNKKSAFAYLNDQYLADMQAGRAFLLLDQSHEGYQTTWLWEWFHNNCNQ